MFKKLFGAPKSSSSDVKPHGQTDAMSTIERLNEVSYLFPRPHQGNETKT